MSGAFPQSLRDLAMTLDKASATSYSSLKTLDTMGLDDPQRPDAVIVRSIALKNAATAQVEFDRALADYLASERK